jgi:hypothetical protein
VSRLRATLLGVMAAAPAVLATVALLVFAGRELSGTTPLSDGLPRNVAEAAGSAQVAEVLRFLRAGEDPRRFWPVRPDIISSTVTRPTGLEAAVFTGSGLMELLDRRGYIRDGGTRLHLACLAKDVGKTEVVEYLFPGPPPSCEPDVALNRVKDRSVQR